MCTNLHAPTNQILGLISANKLAETVHLLSSLNLAFVKGGCQKIMAVSMVNWACTLEELISQSTKGSAPNKS